MVLRRSGACLGMRTRARDFPICGLGIWFCCCKCKVSLRGLRSCCCVRQLRVSDAHWVMRPPKL